MGVTPPPTIVLIRHGEKPADAGAPHGVNKHGEPDDHSLSVRGWTRAGALAAVLAQAPLDGRPGLVRPARVFATRPTHAYRSTRECDTALPTALRLGLETDGTIEHGHEDELARAVQSGSGDALIVWHHRQLPTLARALAPANPDIPATWPDDRFDLFWILAPDPGDGRYRFAVLAQLLLDGDAEWP